jgi:hypothetical protein
VNIDPYLIQTTLWIVGALCVVVMIYAAFPNLFRKKDSIDVTPIAKHPAVYTAVAVIVQLIGVSILSTLAYAVCIWQPMPFWVEALIVISFGVLGWSKLLFDTPGMETPLYAYWFVTNEPLHAMVVGKLITTHQPRADTTTVDVDNPLKSFDSSSLREIGPGWHGIMPWERKVRCFSLKVKILIGNGFEEGEEPLVAKTKNNIPLEIAWLAPLTAMQGYLTNAAQYTDEGQIREFRAVFVTFLLGFVNHYTDTEIFAMMETEEAKKLEAAFKTVLGGKDVATKFEKFRGIYSGDPQFNGIRYQKGYLDAQQAAAKAEKVREAREIMTRGMSDAQKNSMNQDFLMMLATSLAGALGNIDPLVVVGGGMNGVDSSALLGMLKQQREGGGKGKDKQKSK